jgi:addiction module HigA family antidote
MDTNYQEDGINGLGEGIVNVNSKEFKFLQKMIQQKSNSLSAEEKLQNKLLSIKLRMYAYLEQNDAELVEAGRFLDELVKSINIKKKIFAEYVQTKESNLSALFSGKRRINAELAIKLGRIFSLDPVLWMNIQTKNDIAKVNKQKEQEFQHYSLDTLLEKKNLMINNA